MMLLSCGTFLYVALVGVISYELTNRAGRYDGIIVVPRRICLQPDIDIENYLSEAIDTDRSVALTVAKVSIDTDRWSAILLHTRL